MGDIPVLNLLRALNVIPQALHLIRESSAKAFFLSVSAIALVGVAPAAMGVLTKLMVDRLASGSTFDKGMRLLILLLLAFAVIASIAQQASDYWRIKMRNQLQQHLRHEIAKHAATLDLSFFERPSNYDMFDRARRDLGFRPFVMSYALIFAFQQLVVVLGFTITVIAFQPLLALALMISALPTLFVAGKTSTEVYSSQSSLTPKRRRADYLDRILTEDRYAKEVRLYNLAPQLLKKFSRLTSEIFSENIRILKARTVRFIGADAISVTIQYFALVFVVLRVVTGSATVGDFTLLLVALTNVRQGLTEMLAQLGEVYENSLFFNDLTRFLAEEPKIVSPHHPQSIPKRVRELALENVVFAYPGSAETIFDGLSLELRAGEVTGLVGINGAGKTTLVKLLTRLYQPQQGKITLNGIDISLFDFHEYRDCFGVLLQDFARYQFTARENILLGRYNDSANRNRLLQAATEAGATTMVETLPEGWETWLGRQFHDRGQDLSGGQWQRIALARMLYRDAPILVLDEPSAALDAEAEAALFDDYKSLTANKTTLLITHRFTTVRMADRILVMEDGKVIEEGTHTSLLKLGGRYAKLFNAQAKAFRSLEEVRSEMKQ
ncbi:MAG: ABC transporter ATP-binding protein [Truepera sp.]|nr:ABC transporter ATP-binding protein [Truepera sp.]